jgi:hypothetical protein
MLLQLSRAGWWGPTLQHLASLSGLMVLAAGLVLHSGQVHTAAGQLAQDQVHHAQGLLWWVVAH